MRRDSKPILSGAAYRPTTVRRDEEGAELAPGAIVGPGESRPADARTDSAGSHLAEHARLTGGRRG